MDNTTASGMSESRLPHEGISTPSLGIRDLAQELIEEILSYYIVGMSLTNFDALCLNGGVHIF